MQGREKFIEDGWQENRLLFVPCQHSGRLLATISLILHAVGTGR